MLSPAGRETRELVAQAMAQLISVPSSAARMMRSNKSGIVGLITGAISLSIEPATPSGLADLFIVKGIQRAVRGVAAIPDAKCRHGSGERYGRLSGTVGTRNRDASDLDQWR